VPVPDSGTAIGSGEVPPVPRFRVAVLAPEPPGVNMMFTEQIPLFGSTIGGVPAGVEQVSAVNLKSAAFGPVMESELLGKVMEFAVLLVTVRPRVGGLTVPTLTFPKASDVGFNVICERPVATSVTGIASGEPFTVTFTVSVAVSGPFTVGLKSGMIVQCPPLGATEAPKQVDDVSTRKSAAFVPVIGALLKVIAALLPLVT